MALPAAIVTSENPTSLTLPPRIVRYRFLGLFPIAAGLLMVGFDAVWTISALVFFAFTAPPPMNVIGYIFAAFGIPLLLASLAPIGIGLAFFFPSYTQIIIDDRNVRVIERVRTPLIPLRWTSWRRRSRITSLRVISSPMPASDYAAISARCSSGKRSLLIAPAYSRDLLVPLAHEISARLAPAADPLAVLQAGAESAHAPPTPPAGPEVDVDPLPASSPAATPADPPVPSPPARPSWSWPISPRPAP